MGSQVARLRRSTVTLPLRQLQAFAQGQVPVLYAPFCSASSVGIFFFPLVAKGDRDHVLASGRGDDVGFSRQKGDGNAKEE